MAASLIPVADHGKEVHVIGDLMLVIGALDFSGNYAVGGDALDLRPYFKQWGNGEVWAAWVAGAPRGYSFEYDVTNQKIIVRHGDNDAVADGPDTQLAAAAYPAALDGATDIKLVAIGR